jgi:hypothetical protein
LRRREGISRGAGGFHVAEILTTDGHG